MIASKVLVDRYYRGRDIALKEPCERTEEDIKFLTGWLCEGSTVFADSLEEDSLREVASHVTLKKYRPNELIYQQEELIENFHVILRGSLSLLVDPNFRAKQLASQAAASNVDSLLKDSSGIKTAAQAPSTSHPTSAKRNRVCYGKQVGKLYAGKYFGHEALMQKEELLPFTIFTDEHVELLTVCGDLFDRFLLPHFLSRFLERAQFLTQLEMFSKWSPHLLRQLCLALEEKHYQLGDCLFRQDMPIHCVYIIKSGSVKLSIGRTNTQPQCRKEVVEKIEPEKDYLAEILAEDDRERMNLKNTVSVHTLNALSTTSLLLSRSLSQTSVRSSFSIATRAMSASSATTRKRRKSNVKIPVKKRETTPSVFGFKLQEPMPKNTSSMCDLGPGDMLGDIEAICRLKHNLFHAVCLSDTVVYALDLYYFEQLFQKKAPHTVYQMVARASQRVESWKNRYSRQCGNFFTPLVTVLEQLEGKLVAKGYHKTAGGGKQVAFTPEELAHIAIEVLGKASTSVTRGDTNDGDTISEMPDNLDTDTCTTAHTEPCPTRDSSSSESQTQIPTCFDSGSLLKHHPRPFSTATCATSCSLSAPNSSLKRCFSVSSVPLQRQRSATDTTPHTAQHLPMPVPSSYPVKEETTTDCDSFSTLLTQDDLEQAGDKSNITLAGPQCNTNLAKIRAELLQKIKSESVKQSMSTNPISTHLYWTNHQQSVESVAGGLSTTLDSVDNAIGSQPIVVPTAVRQESTSTIVSDTAEEEEPVLIDLCDDTNTANEEKDRESEKLSVEGDLKSSPPLHLDHNDTTIPDEYKALLVKRPSSQIAASKPPKACGYPKRPSTAPNLRISGNRNGMCSKDLTEGDKQPVVHTSVMKMYTLVPQKSLLCKHRASIPANIHLASRQLSTPSPSQQLLRSRKHISLSTMEKEGHLHLAGRPWKGGYCRRPPSAPVGQPTVRRRVQPRPPVNLTPHMQKPFYL